MRPDDYINPCFAEGDVHGFESTGAEPFVYIAVTSPPIKFNYAYGIKE